MQRQVLAFFLLAACGGDDPVSYSSPVGINLKAESGDVTGTAISDDKGINTESGNPYGAFVSAATAKIGGPPARVEVDHLTLTLGGTSTGVTVLEQVYTGNVDVLFIMNDTNNSYPVGTIANPKGSGPDDVHVTFASKDVGDVDFQKYLGGSFKVVIRGTAAPDFSTKGAKADLQLNFTFAAFE